MEEGNGERKGDGPGPKRPDRAGRTSGAGRRPVLTERQRREAREARRRRGRRPAKGGGKRTNPLTNGIRATGRELSRAFAFLGGLILNGLDALSPVGRALAGVFRQVGQAIVRLLELATRGIAAVGRAIGRAVRAADRVLTPARALVIVAFVSAFLLGWSQFIDYRAVEIGQPGYAEVLDVATPPKTDARTPIDQHSFVLVLAALVALVGTALAAGGRRPIAALLVSAAGLVAVAVALLVDLPAGTDASEIAAAYSGAEAVLLAGFWLQIAAGAGLAFCGAMMATLPRPVRRPVRSRRRRPVAAGETG